MDVTEDFSKVNDYTLSVDQTLGSNGNWGRDLTRLFNFKSGQVTTLYREWITYGQAPTTTSQMSTHNFADIQSKEEIRDMHAKLKQLGGNPPDIEELLGGTQKSRLSAPGAQ